MSEVKRWNHTIIHQDSDDVESSMITNSTGRYVRYEDYEALAQQLTAATNSLTNAQEALKSAGIEADTVQAGVMELVSRINQVVVENAALKEYLKECSVVQGEGNWTGDAEKSVYVPAEDWMPTTPATDAYLNAVRADVLLQFFNEQMEWALVNWQWSNFTSLERAAIREGDCELSGVVLMLKKIADFENELRAGNAGKDGV